MAYQETKTNSYGSRVGNSFKNVLLGIVMFIGATILLWWNEGNYVKQEKMLNDAQEACIDMPKTDKIDPAFEGELVCASALATTDEVLTDNDFGISENAIGLSRKVEYFQWVEHAEEHKEDKVGGKEVVTTTYTYTKEWVSNPQNSDKFHDPQYQGRNHTWVQIENLDQRAENVSFGAYQLNASLISSINSKEGVELNISEQLLRQWNQSVSEAYARIYSVPVVAGNTAAAPNAAVAPEAEAAVDDSLKTTLPDSISQANKIDLEFVHQVGNLLYYGRSANVPEIGDVRITFEKVVPAKVTIISQVKGNTFKAFKSSNGRKFQTLVMGVHDSEEIFDSEHEANSMWTWVLRIVGILLVISGLKNLFSFLETLLKVLPFLSNIFAFGVGIICTVVGIVWSFIIISLAWLFYRPLIGITLLVIAGFLVWVFAFNGKKKLADLASKGKAAPAAADNAQQ